MQKYVLGPIYFLNILPDVPPPKIHIAISIPGHPSDLMIHLLPYFAIFYVADLEPFPQNWNQIKFANFHLHYY
jgi:hypothetical protein